jgi:hypothetical protein
VRLIDAPGPDWPYRWRTFKLGWQDGQAQIVARQTHDGVYRKGINVVAAEGLYHHVYDYVADVTPDAGGPMFRATFTEMFESDTEYRPVPGDQARVRFNPKDESVAFDRSVLQELAKASHDASSQQFATLAAAAPGSATASPGTDAVGAVVADLAASTADFSGTMAAIKAARAAGDLAEVDRLKAEYKARSGG